MQGSALSLCEMHELSGSEDLSHEKMRPVEKLVEVPLFSGERTADGSERKGQKKMSTIKDSGERREFEVNGVKTGGVRDVSDGKGRCDLMPLDVIASDMHNLVLTGIANYLHTKAAIYLHGVLGYFCDQAYNGCKATMYLELAKHFEEGAKKYGEHNWQKGLPLHCYIDSALRHYLKWLREDNDEPHDRAFVWNIVCCMWTAKHLPEMDDLVPAVTCTLDEIKVELGLDGETEQKVRRKTYLEDLLERLPSAKMNGVHPEACRAELYGDCDCTELSSCEICWNEVMEE